jgi:hypothetical protein
MERKSVVMTLCPNCKSIQKADSVCSICKYPIPPKDPEPEGEDQEKKVQSSLARVLQRIGQYGYRSRLPQDDEEEEEPEQPAAAPKKPKIPAQTRIRVNDALTRAGLDGNGRFGSPTEAFSKAGDVLKSFGIWLEAGAYSWALNNYENFRTSFEVSWIVDDATGGNVLIENSELFMTWYKFRDEVFEAIAYLS